MDDVDTTDVDKPVSVHVLRNDDFGGSIADELTLRVVDAATHGTTRINGENIRYEPDGGFVGVEVFAYEICSIDGDCDQATVLVAVTPSDEEDAAAPPPPAEDAAAPPPPALESAVLRTAPSPNVPADQPLSAGARAADGTLG